MWFSDRERLCRHDLHCVCQLVEKSWEHKLKAFLTFIDLKKAYESVPRKAMWLALGKLGVPERIIHLIRSFDEDMRARVCIKGVTLEEI